MSYKKATEIIESSQDYVKSFNEFVSSFWGELSKVQKSRTVINFAKCITEL